MKEYEVKKTVELTFRYDADNEQDAEAKAWSIDDARAIDYVVYDIEILNPDEDDVEDGEQ